MGGKAFKFEWTEINIQDKGGSTLGFKEGELHIQKQLWYNKLKLETITFFL